MEGKTTRKRKLPDEEAPNTAKQKGHGKSKLHTTTIPNGELPMSLNNDSAARNGKITLPSMTEAYDSTVRPMIDGIDLMRKLGLDNDVSLPSITVIGDQSAGKSSVLEAISGIQLPRGKGIVTRCPIELRLRHTQDSEAWSAKISYHLPDKKDIEEDIESREQIGNRIRKAQNDLAGTDNGISHKLVSLTIESNEVPDLTLVDLPGITRVAVGTQDKDIPKKIKRLIRDRIKDQSAIILAVVPANVDVANNEALVWAEEFDPDGERTLGVITKPDLVDKGAEEIVIEAVNNQVCPLVKGYTMVKCRGQLDIDNHVTLGEALAEEERFFKDHPKYGDIPTDLRGTRNLAIKLSLELRSHIKECLPRLEQDIKEKLKDTERKLSYLCEAVPEPDGDKIRYFLKVIESFVTSIESAIHTPSADMDADYRLFKEARAASEDFMTQIESIPPQKSPALGYFAVPNDMNFRSQIEKDIENYRSREIPTFQSYKVFEQTMKKQVSACRKPAMQCLETIRTKVQHVLTKQAEYHFHRFPKLCFYVKTELNKIENRRFHECTHKLEEHLKMEEMIFVQDKSFLKTHETQKKSSDQLATRSDDEQELAVDDMYSKMYTYMENFRGRLSDTVPMIIIYNLLDKLHEEIKKEFGVFVTNPSIVEMMSEKANIQQQRRDLTFRIERLTKAESKLAEVNMEL